jgi:hypothetical protein
VYCVLAEPPHSSSASGRPPVAFEGGRRQAVTHHSITRGITSTATRQLVGAWALAGVRAASHRIATPTHTSARGELRTGFGPLFVLLLDAPVSTC